MVSNYSSTPHNPSEWFIDYNCLLGKGALSEGVYKAKKINGIINGIHIPNNGECAIKIISKIINREIEVIDKLLKVYSTFRSNNVIKFYGYGYCDSDNKLYIYMEYLDGYISIRKILDENNKKFEEKEMEHILREMALALLDIHDNDIIHRDIKCDNILYNLHTGKIKLIDFGISKDISIRKEQLQTINVGTPSHLPPESRLSIPSNPQSDIWSLGCTLLEMYGILDKSKEAIIIPSLSNEFVNILQRCLIKDPNQRLGLREILFRLKIKEKILRKPSELIPKSGIESYNQPLTPNSIPESVTSLELVSHNQPLIPNSIPESVKSLQLVTYNQPLTPNSIPESVESLKLVSYNQPLAPGLIPKSVIELILKSYNQPLTPNSIPESVESLELVSYNQPLAPGLIPKSVTLLILKSYNQPLTPNSIPKSVKSLELVSYNQPLTPNSIPESVTSLELVTYNQPLIPNSIPKSVKSLELVTYNQPLTPNSIPESVESLKLVSYNQIIEYDSIPSSVFELTFGDKFEFNDFGDYIPDSIKKFTCSYHFKSALKNKNYLPIFVGELNLLNYNQPISPKSIPNTTHTLNLGSNYTHFDSLSFLPPSVISLSFGVPDDCKLKYSQIEQIIPKTVTKFRIRS